MDKAEPGLALQDLDEQDRELQRLEQQAGLSQRMKIARTRRDPAPGALGVHASPQEYIAHDYDQRRGTNRDAYFSVDDEPLRKRLIALSRQIEGRHRQSTDEQIETSLEEISLANTKAERRPWGKAMLLGTALLGFGYWASQVAGAIAGAIAAVFLGLGIIANAHNNARLRLAQARRSLEQAKKERDSYLLFPEVFSAAEEASARRDADFDLESAYRNVLRGQENQR